MREWIVFQGEIFPNTDDYFFRVIRMFCAGKHHSCNTCEFIEFCEMSEKEMLDNKNAILRRIGAIISG